MMEHVVPGDQLAQLLLDADQGLTHVTIAPPPSSWAPARTAVLQHARAAWQRGRRPPTLSGFPLCVAGLEHRELRVRASGGAAPEPCARCSRRAACSPPSVWSEEMMPFGPPDTLDLWRAFHAHFTAATGSALRLELDDWVALLARRRGPRRPLDCILEPSISIGPRGILPRLRVAAFPGEPRGALLRSEGPLLLRVFAAQHQLFGVPLDPEVTRLLGSFGRLSLPTGFELDEEGQLDMKAYVRLHASPPEERRRLVTGLVERSAAARALPVDAVRWQDVDMVGFSTRAGAVSTVKVYVHADPSAGFRAGGLPAVPASHPLVALSGGQALAVLDLCAPRARPPKWDFRLRDELLTGPVVVRRLGGLVSGEAAGRVHHFLADPPFHVAVVAAALRAESLTLYLEIA